MKEIFDYMIEHSGGNSIDFNAMIEDINKLTQQLAESEAERLEQARLLDMSAERELRLRAEKAQIIRDFEILTKGYVETIERLTK